jgi:hypothetical protein
VLVVGKIYLFFGITKSAMANLDEEYRTNSNYNNIVVAVKTDVEEEKSSEP